MTELLRTLAKFSGTASTTLRGIKRGMEKEALRITPHGKLAQTPHPSGLGSALTHSRITTDFSEALLEFITPPCPSIQAMLDSMDVIHRFVYPHLHAQQELLWVASMPCVIESDDLIPIANYGTSNSGQMKHIYRVGLSHRYGRSMQTIAGIHYNFSLPDEFWSALQSIEGNQLSLQNYKTEKYFSLIRNFRRYFWLMLYLFGASPAICPTFVRQRQHTLQPFNDHSLYYPFATSLRMGDLGYQSNAQASIMADYNSLDGYAASLLRALTKPHPDYEKIGVKENGIYKQLNANLLQIENEFYSTIRPKRTTRRGQTPMRALHDHGVEYIEVRSVDINPFDPVGIDSTQAHFIEVFLLFCLLETSPPSDAAEYRQIAENQRRVVNRGRDPSLQVYCHGKEVSLRNCGSALLDQLTPVADWLAGALDDGAYHDCLAPQRAKLADAQLTPSARMLQQMESKDQSFFRLAWEQARQLENHFLARPLPPGQQAEFEQWARDSLESQKAIESSDSQSLAEYLDAYFDQYRSLST